MNALTTTSDASPAVAQDNAAIVDAAQKQVEQQQALVTAQADEEQKQKNQANEAANKAVQEAANPNSAPIPIPQPVPVYMAPVEQPLVLQAEVNGRQVQVPQQAAQAVANANSNAVTLSTQYSATQLNSKTQQGNSNKG